MITIGVDDQRNQSDTGVKTSDNNLIAQAGMH